MERMKKMVENLSGEERAKMMERCFEIMKGKEIGNGKEPDEKKKEDSRCSPPDMDKMAECCPEMMGSFFSRMKGCFEGTGNDEMNGAGEKTQNQGCCPRRQP